MGMKPDAAELIVGVKRRRWLRTLVVIVACCTVMGVLLVVLALWPLPTHQGVNYNVTRYTIPAYVKAMEFVTRHWRYRELAQRIVADRKTPQDRVIALYEWTRKHIQPIPRHFPVVDDHIWHIIVRGYGGSDQQADVFTTLCVYAGIPAFWRIVSPVNGGRKLVLSFVRLDHGWTVFAVALDWTFYDAQGRLLTLAQLQQMPNRLQPHRYRGVDASAYIAPLANLQPPQPLRAHLQMPWLRLRYELKKQLFD